MKKLLLFVSLFFYVACYAQSVDTTVNNTDFRDLDYVTVWKAVRVLPAMVIGAKVSISTTDPQGGQFTVRDTSEGFKIDGGTVIGDAARTSKVLVRNRRESGIIQPEWFKVKNITEILLATVKGVSNVETAKVVDNDGAKVTYQWNDTSTATAETHYVVNPEGEGAWIANLNFIDSVYGKDDLFRIPLFLRFVGMQRKVVSENAMYELTGGVANVNWQAIQILKMCDVEGATGLIKDTLENFANLNAENTFIDTQNFAVINATENIYGSKQGVFNQELINYKQLRTYRARSGTGLYESLRNGFRSDSIAVLSVEASTAEGGVYRPLAITQQGYASGFPNPLFYIDVNQQFFPFHAGIRLNGTNRNFGLAGKATSSHVLFREIDTIANSGSASATVHQFVRYETSYGTGAQNFWEALGGATGTTSMGYLDRIGNLNLQGTHINMPNIAAYTSGDYKQIVWNTSTGNFQIKDTATSSGSSGWYQIGAAAANIATAADGTSYYLGASSASGITSQSAQRVYITKSGTIKSVYVFFDNSGVTATAETSTVAIRVNTGAYTTISSAVTNDAAQTEVNNTALNITVTAGQYLTIRWSTPTDFATNPTNVRVSAAIGIQY